MTLLKHIASTRRDPIASSQLFDFFKSLTQVGSGNFVFDFSMIKGSFAEDNDWNENFGLTLSSLVVSFLKTVKVQNEDINAFSIGLNTINTAHSKNGNFIKVATHFGSRLALISTKHPNYAKLLQSLINTVSELNGSQEIDEFNIFSDSSFEYSLNENMIQNARICRAFLCNVFGLLGLDNEVTHLYELIINSSNYVQTVNNVLTKNECKEEDEVSFKAWRLKNLVTDVAVSLTLMKLFQSKNEKSVYFFKQKIPSVNCKSLIDGFNRPNEVNYKQKVDGALHSLQSRLDLITDVEELELVEKKLRGDINSLNVIKFILDNRHLILTEQTLGGEPDEDVLSKMYGVLSGFRKRLEKIDEFKPDLKTLFETLMCEDRQQMLIEKFKVAEDNELDVKKKARLAVLGLGDNLHELDIDSFVKSVQVKLVQIDFNSDLNMMIDCLESAFLLLKVSDCIVDKTLITKLSIRLFAYGYHLSRQEERRDSADSKRYLSLLNVFLKDLSKAFPGKEDLKKGLNCVSSILMNSTPIDLSNLSTFSDMMLFTEKICLSSYDAVELEANEVESSHLDSSNELYKKMVPARKKAKHQKQNFYQLELKDVDLFLKDNLDPKVDWDKSTVKTFEILMFRSSENNGSTININLNWPSAQFIELDSPGFFIPSHNNLFDLKVESYKDINSLIELCNEARVDISNQFCSLFGAEYKDVFKIIKDTFEGNGLSPEKKVLFERLLNLLGENPTVYLVVLLSYELWLRKLSEECKALSGSSGGDFSRLKYYFKCMPIEGDGSLPEILQNIIGDHDAKTKAQLYFSAYKVLISAGGKRILKTQRGCVDTIANSIVKKQTTLIAQVPGFGKSYLSRIITDALSDWCEFAQKPYSIVFIGRNTFCNINTDDLKKRETTPLQCNPIQLDQKNLQNLLEAYLRSRNESFDDIFKELNYYHSLKPLLKKIISGNIYIICDEMDDPVIHLIRDFAQKLGVATMSASATPCLPLLAANLYFTLINHDTSVTAVQTKCVESSNSADEKLEEDQKELDPPNRDMYEKVVTQFFCKSANPLDMIMGLSDFKTCDKWLKSVADKKAQYGDWVETESQNLRDAFEVAEQNSNKWESAKQKGLINFELIKEDMDSIHAVLNELNEFKYSKAPAVYVVDVSGKLQEDSIIQYINLNSASDYHLFYQGKSLMLHTPDGVTTEYTGQSILENKRLWMWYIGCRSVGTDHGVLSEREGPVVLFANDQADQGDIFQGWGRRRGGVKGNLHIVSFSSNKTEDCTIADLEKQFINNQQNHDRDKVEARIVLDNVTRSYLLFDTIEQCLRQSIGQTYPYSGLVGKEGLVLNVKRPIFIGEETPEDILSTFSDNLKVDSNTSEKQAAVLAESLRNISDNPPKFDKDLLVKRLGIYNCKRKLDYSTMTINPLSLDAATITSLDNIPVSSTVGVMNWLSINGSLYGKDVKTKETLQLMEQTLARELLAQPIKNIFAVLAKIGLFELATNWFSDNGKDKLIKSLKKHFKSFSSSVDKTQQVLRNFGKEPRDSTPTRAMYLSDLLLKYFLNDILKFKSEFLKSCKSKFKIEDVNNLFEKPEDIYRDLVKSTLQSKPVDIDFLENATRVMTVIRMLNILFYEIVLKVFENPMDLISQGLIHKESENITLNEGYSDEDGIKDQVDQKFRQLKECIPNFLEKIKKDFDTISSKMNSAAASSEEGVADITDDNQ